MSHEFSERPFVAGSVIGLRAFDVDRLGRLLGPQQRDVFRPGVNEAVCHAKDYAPGGMTFSNSIWGSTYYSYAPTFTLTADTSGFTRSMRRVEHRMGIKHERDCADCVGEEPTKKAPESMGISAAFKEALEEERKAQHVVGSVDCACGYYAYFDGLNSYKNKLNVGAIIEGFGVCTVGSRGFRASKAQLVALIEPKAAFAPATWSLVRRNYPDVPVYANRHAAMDAHPLTVPETPTPDAEDFWTRSAS